MLFHADGTETLLGSSFVTLFSEDSYTQHAVICGETSIFSQPSSLHNQLHYVTRKVASELSAGIVRLWKWAWSPLMPGWTRKKRAPVVERRCITHRPTQVQLSDCVTFRQCTFKASSDDRPQPVTEFRTLLVYGRYASLHFMSVELTLILDFFRICFLGLKETKNIIQINVSLYLGLGISSCVYGKVYVLTVLCPAFPSYLTAEWIPSYHKLTFDWTILGQLAM